MADARQDNIDVSDQVDRARALMNQGIAAVQAGDLDAGRAALEEAEEISTLAEAYPTAIAAHINRGWAEWIAGNHEDALEFYVEAIEAARNTNDDERLRSGLANAGAVFSQLGRHHEAAAVWEEYLEHAPEDHQAVVEARLAAGLAYLQLEKYEQAEMHFDEAERLASQARLLGLVSAARLDLALVRERTGDMRAARSLYRDALDAAHESKSSEHIATATITLAHAHHRAGDYSSADREFTEAEDLFRASGERDRLADALYWHGISLRAAEFTERALIKWREEEPVRRELGDDAGLGDCLFEQALVQRDRDEHLDVERLMIGAADAYERSNALIGLANVRFAHADWLRERGRDEEARVRVDECLRVVESAHNPQTECRALMLRSLLLADDGEIAEALEELEKADDAAIAVGSRELLTSVHGRRAYVMAADGRPAEEVAGQLEETFEYGETYLPTELALERTLEALEEIRSRFPEAYGDALSKLKRRLKSGEVRAAREAAAMAASQAQAAEDAPAAGTDPDTAHTSEPAE